MQVVAVVISGIVELWLVLLMKPMYQNVYRKIYYAVGAKMDAWGSVE